MFDGAAIEALRAIFTEVCQDFEATLVLWSPSYFAASCGGAPIASCVMPPASP